MTKYSIWCKKLFCFVFCLSFEVVCTFARETLFYGKICAVVSSNLSSLVVGKNPLLIGFLRSYNASATTFEKPSLVALQTISEVYSKSAAHFLKKIAASFKGRLF